MNIAEIESELLDLIDEPFEPTAFVYRFLEIYNAPKATITKLKQGSGNHAQEAGDVLWKNKLFFRAAEKGQAASAVDAMLADPLTKKHKPRFVFATDGDEVYCQDTKADVAIDPVFKKLNDHFLFFLPLANIERYEAPAENPADIKATGRIAKLYDAILDANGDWIERDYTHDLNQFMTRLLFCFFAEDTSIFEKDLFTSTVMSRTNEDGSDTSAVLDLVFEAMNTKPEDRGNLPDYAKRFPYVNGGLFHDKTRVPKFSKRARRLLQECGELYWKDINPDIFGSMIQAVAQPGLREDMGMHYTSVPNIMKVLQPLFLLSLEEEFLAARDAEPKLKKLLQRIYNIRVFDPACGSGNFLIIAYKELRRLEMRIFERQREIAKQWSLPMTGVQLTQFFGIELTDFATETAKLSLWIAEYQMNELFKTAFGEAPPSLPLKDGGNILQGNAAETDWLGLFVGGLKGNELFIAGNPPFVWSGDQTPSQKADLQMAFDGTNSYRMLNYVCIWFRKASEFIEKTGASAAFVSTNTICQGEQAGILWPVIFDHSVEIFFAHQAFKWRNLASANAGVTCVIIGMRRKSAGKKHIYSGEHREAVDRIGPYLIEMDQEVVKSTERSLFGLPEMVRGNMPYDGGNLILSPVEKEELLRDFPNSSCIVRRLYGSQEVTKGVERWCLWISSENLDLANSIPPIAKRIERVKELRSSNADKSVQRLAERSHQFREFNAPDEIAIVIPAVSSEERDVLPCVIFGNEAAITNRCYQIIDPELYIFSLIVSRMHYVWAETVGGKLENRFNYSNTVVYNTFPVPRLSEIQKEELEAHALNILGIRESFPGQTLGWLYGAQTMPTELQEAHRDLDGAVERLYVGHGFTSDAHRFEHLFKLYMVRRRQIIESTSTISELR